MLVRVLSKEGESNWIVGCTKHYLLHYLSLLYCFRKTDHSADGRLYLCKDKLLKAPKGLKRTRLYVDNHFASLVKNTSEATQPKQRVAVRKLTS